jgi:hypothetical protein
LPERAKAGNAVARAAGRARRDVYTTGTTFSPRVLLRHDELKDIRRHQPEPDVMRATDSRTATTASEDRVGRETVDSASGVRRVLDKNGEVDPTIFSAASDMQLSA